MTQFSWLDYMFGSVWLGAEQVRRPRASRVELLGCFAPVGFAPAIVQSRCFVGQVQVLALIGRAQKLAGRACMGVQGAGNAVSPLAKNL
ncbi:hypothetical protein ACNKU7_08945 [Microbulbifer sp. SA54]|uniref:hypothetical protein n=1 Tax=Microbulbifer sp. SA54 TaxID=3401577 RepID=UPI003AAE42A6